MTKVLFRSAFQWAATAGDVMRFAAATSHADSVMSLHDDAEWEGGVGVQVERDKWVRYPIQEDPGEEWCIHFWARQHGGTTAVNGTGVVFQLADASGGIGPLRIVALTSGRVSLQLSGSSVWASETDFSTTLRHYRLRVVEHATAGVIEFYVDSDLVYSSENANTSRNGTADRIQMGARTRREWRHSHVILTDGENLGVGALVSYFPASHDVAPNEWTKSDVNKDHFEHLSPTPHDGDTNYLRSEDAGEKTRHRAAISGLADRRIVAAGVVAVARMEQESGDRLGLSVESGQAAPETSETGDFNETYTPRQFPALEVDPDTSEAWTEQGLSGAEFEIEHLAPEG